MSAPRIVTRGVSGGRKRQTYERWEGFRSSLVPDGSTVVFDNTLGNPEVGGDVLAGVTRQDKVHDLVLAGREPGTMFCRVLSTVV